MRHHYLMYNNSMKRSSRVILSVSSLLIILVLGVFVLTKNANLLLKGKLENAVKGFSSEKIELTWKSIEIFNAVFKKDDGTPAFKSDSIYLSFDLLGILKKDYSLSRLTLKNPYMLIEIDRQGRIINPLKPSGPLPPIIIKQLVIHGGSIDYSDGAITGPPFITKLRNIEVEINNLAVPFKDTLASFVIKAQAPGRHTAGMFKSTGNINMKTRDLNCQVSLSNLDLTNFKPYFQKKSEANISRGLLDLDLRADIKAGFIKAPGKATLKDLAFQSTGSIKDTFIGIPRSSVLYLLKNNKGAIIIDFVLTGDFKDPRFNLRESFTEKLTKSLAEKLGLDVNTIGKTVVKGGAMQLLRKIFK